MNIYPPGCYLELDGSVEGYVAFAGIKELHASDDLCLVAIVTSPYLLLPFLTHSKPHNLPHLFPPQQPTNMQFTSYVSSLPLLPPPLQLTTRTTLSYQSRQAIPLFPPSHFLKSFAIVPRRAPPTCVLHGGKSLHDITSQTTLRNLVDLPQLSAHQR